MIMPIEVAVYANASDCFIVWKTDQIPGCLGFAIQAQVNEKRFNLNNRLGFRGHSQKLGETRSSTQWPFQRYDWTHHRLKEGDVASYRVVPVLGSADHLVPDEDNASAWTPKVTVTANASGGRWVYFNRGVVLSQFMARVLNGDFSKTNLDKLKGELKIDSDQLRQFLGGDILKELKAFLSEVKADPDVDLYVALYELDDEEIIKLLIDIGERAHVILSNGSDRSGDGNAKAAAALQGRVDLSRRMLKSKGLGHNKFALTFKDQQPRKLLTGSTNWALTGLCTQVNNVLVVESGTPDNDAILWEYSDQWDALLAAKSDFSKQLKANNSKIRGKASGKWNIWFAPTNDHVDLESVSAMIAKAQHSIHFLMFNPGTNGLLQPVLQAQIDNPNLIVLGVVNQLSLTKTAGAGENKQTVRVNLVSPEFSRSFPLEVIEPEGVRNALGPWAAEVTRRDFLGPSEQHPNIGHAIVHAKILILDGLSDDPVVITGSHNFSKSASEKNDENLLVLRKAPALAKKYLVEINTIYEHYRWRAYLTEHNNLAAGLDPSPDWQQKKLTKAQRDAMRFWVG
jgi:phosphatidylserine/phosphatidylglycerophosphate/cardiolipin synthase-like enzyme